MPVQSPYAFAQIGAVRIVVQHGHMLASDDIARVGHRYGADVFITGHTHVPVIRRLGGVIHLNPGSPAHPKFQRDGEFVPTVGVIEDGAVQVIELQSGNVLISERLR
jgi:putative phosphoesterase